MSHVSPRENRTRVPVNRRPRKMVLTDAVRPSGQDVGGPHGARTHDLRVAIRRRWTISRILFPFPHPKARGRATTIPLAPPSLAGSSDLPGGFGRAVLITPPYLVLLRAGFSLPSALQRTRCALTAPFHPYPPPPSRASVGGIFSVPLSFRSPRPGITRRTALWSSDFPPRVLPPEVTSRAAVVCPSTTDCQRTPMYPRAPTTARVHRRLRALTADYPSSS